MTMTSMPPAEPAGDAIDARVLARLRAECDCQGARLSDELLAVYAAELHPRLEAIRDAIGRRDLAALSYAAHALKGGSSLIGAQPLAQLCLQLERAAREGAIEDARALLPALAREEDRLCQALGALTGRAMTR